MAWWRFSSANGGPTRSGSGWRTSEAAGHEQVQAVLGECCAYHAPARIALRDGTGRVDARFSVLGARELRLDLLTADALDAFEPLAACAVSFAVRQHAYSFLSLVRRVERVSTPERPRQIALRTPTSLAQEDLRTAHRVAPDPGTLLELRLVCEGRGTWEPRVLNLSMSGALLELGDDLVPHIPAHEELRLELRLGEDRAQIHARARRQDGARLAVVFPGAVRDGDVEPPLDLARIVRELERRWLRRRPASPPAASSLLGR